MSEQKDFFSSPDRTPESHQLPNQELEQIVELQANPISQESLDITEQNEPIFTSPKNEAVGVVQETLEEFDHAKAVHDKKSEAVILEHLLADETVTEETAFDVMNAAKNFAQSE